MSVQNKKKKLIIVVVIVVLILIVGIALFLFTNCRKYDGFLNNVNKITVWIKNEKNTIDDAEFVDQLNGLMTNATKHNYMPHYEGSYNLEAYNEDDLVCEIISFGDETIIIKNGNYYWVNNKEVYNFIGNRITEMYNQKE